MIGTGSFGYVPDSARKGRLNDVVDATSLQNYKESYEEIRRYSEPCSSLT